VGGGKGFHLADGDGVELGEAIRLREIHVSIIAAVASCFGYYAESIGFTHPFFHA